MGVLKKGILGGFSGTVGTVVGSNWRGMDIIRSLPKTSGKLPTEKQLQQRMKFKLSIEFLAPLREIQSRYFGQNYGNQSRTNLATSYMIAEAISTANGLPEVVFSKVQITRGDIAGFRSLLAATPEPGKIPVSWEDNSEQAKAAGTDLFCAALYCEDTGRFSVSEGPETRSAQGANIGVPPEFSGLKVHLYVWLRNEGGTAASDSVYLGDMVAQ